MAETKEMSSLDSTIRSIVFDPAFEATSAPYAVTDRGLRIQAVNTAYTEATCRTRDELVGRYLFDAFPEDEPTHEACGLVNLTASLESVFRRRRRHHMNVQRYDVPAPETEGFVRKVWSPVNSPIRDADGQVVAALIHVEDVTDLYPRPAPEADDADTLPLHGDAETVRALMLALARLDASYRELSAQNEHLRLALDSNRDIGAAIGILMYSRKVTREAAFELLRSTSQRQHRKLRDVAEEVLRTGQLPKAPGEHSEPAG